MAGMCFAATARTTLSGTYQVILPQGAHTTYDIRPGPDTAYQVPAAVLAVLRRANTKSRLRTRFSKTPRCKRAEGPGSVRQPTHVRRHRPERASGTIRRSVDFAPVWRSTFMRPFPRPTAAVIGPTDQRCGCARAPHRMRRALAFRRIIPAILFGKLQESSRKVARGDYVRPFFGDDASGGHRDEHRPQ